MSVTLKVMTCVFLYVFFYLYVLRSTLDHTKIRDEGNEISRHWTMWRLYHPKYLRIEDNGVPFLAPVDVDQHSVGHYVAVNIEEWSNRPLTGEVKKIGELWLPFAGSMALITEHFEIPTLVVVRTDNHGHKKLTKVK